MPKVKRRKPAAPKTPGHHNTVRVSPPLGSGMLNDAAKKIRRRNQMLKNL